MSQLKNLNGSALFPVLNHLDFGVGILKRSNNGFEQVFANKKAQAIFKNERIELPVTHKECMAATHSGAQTEFSAFAPGSPYTGMRVACAEFEDGLLLVMTKESQPGHNASHELEIVFNLLSRESELQKAKQELKSKKLLENIINTSSNAIVAFKAIYNTDGEPQDFEYVMVNDTQLKLLHGKSPVGKKYTDVNANKPHGILNAMKLVMKNGIAVDFENPEIHHKTKNWHRHRLYKIGDILMQATENITARKKTEEDLEQAIRDLKKKESLLREAERIGNMGSWERNVATGELFWSNQLYSIYGLNREKTKADTAFWMEHIVHPEDKKIAENQIAKLYTQLKASRAEYRIVTPAGKIKTVCSEPEVKLDADKNPVLIMGIVTDITDIKKQEQEAQRLQLEQQNELLNAILNAQEEERRRIAEALHNDLGQMLYMTKMKLGPGKKEAEDLLNTAISKTRTISFDLMPSILLDYGLDTAIKDLTKRISAYGISITYTNTDPLKRLSQSFEISIFRIVQELFDNIIKHSGANKAGFAISYSDGAVYITVTDNGKGFTGEKITGSQGFGLRNIKNRLRVHHGSITIKPLRGRGTEIKVTIPLPPEQEL